MTKNELVVLIAAKTGLSKEDAAKFANAFISTVTEELAKGGKVALSGFGIFSVADRAERSGRNPKTGEALTISACKVVKFKAGKELKDSLNS